jgi:hypothetical protein
LLKSNKKAHKLEMPKTHNAAQAEYDRSAALVRHQALKSPGVILLQKRAKV